jgi:hypothetical protein
MAKTVKIVKDPDDPQPLEVMEKAIIDIAEGARKILSSRLNQRAILVLLRDATNEPLVTIERVLNAAASLDKNYLKLAVLALVLGAAGCASAPKTLACNSAAQWFVNDAAGVPSAAVLVCFGADHSLRWTSRAVTPAEKAALTPPPVVKGAAPNVAPAAANGAAPTARPVNKRGRRSHPPTPKPEGA